MKNFKFILSVLICAVVFVSSASIAKAKEFGVVDLTKVLENYSVAQEITADLKIKEAELQKFVVNAQKQVKEAASPVEKKNLEEKLAQQFNIKRNAFAKEQAEKWQNIEVKIFGKIKEMAAQKKLDMVFNEQSVIVGGLDITEEVIKELNKLAKKPAKK